MPGDELIRFRLKCSTSMYKQSTDILDQARFVRFEHDLQKDFHTIVVRFQVRPSKACYILVRLNTTFTRLTGHLQGLHTVPLTFELDSIQFICDIDMVELTRGVDFMCVCI